MCIQKRKSQKQLRKERKTNRGAPKKRRKGRNPEESLSIKINESRTNANSVGLLTQV
jgi:hypothetical protein